MSIFRLAIKQLPILLSAMGLAQLHGQSLPIDGVDGVVQAFQHYPVVAIGEIHSIRQGGDFYDSLIRNREFQNTVNDIVIEFASKRAQPVIDSYINGGDVPKEELRQVWRNSTKVFAFESPIYAELLQTVREVNAPLPPLKRLRVLAGDCWIDWSAVHTREQWAEYQPNNRCFANVIENEVLDKGRRALVILGSGHVMKTTDLHSESDTTMLVERIHPGSVYVIVMSFQKPPQTSIGRFPVLLPWPRVSLPGGQEIIAGAYADALLYLGPTATSAPRDWAEYQNEPGYLEELNRRSRIRWGCDFDLGHFQDDRPLCASK